VIQYGYSIDFEFPLVEVLLSQRDRKGKFQNLPPEDDEEEVHQECFMKECFALPGSEMFIHDTFRFTRKSNCVEIVENCAIDPLNISNKEISQTIAFANKF